jgi:hypothetical protein
MQVRVGDDRGRQTSIRYVKQRMSMHLEQRPLFGNVGRLLWPERRRRGLDQVAEAWQAARMRSRGAGYGAGQVPARQDGGRWLAASYPGRPVAGTAARRLLTGALPGNDAA